MPGKPTVAEAPDLRTMTGNQMAELQEVHCAGCGRFLGKQAIIIGIVQIKCSRCKQWNTIDIMPDQEYIKVVERGRKAT